MTVFNPQCKVCTHPQRDKIETLIKQGMPYREISVVIGGVGFRSIGHHKKHMIYFNVPAEAIKVQVMPSEPLKEIDESQLKDMADPNAWIIVTRTLNKLELLEKVRPLNEGEEHLRQNYLKFLIDVEKNQIAREQVKKDQAQIERENLAQQLLNRLNQEEKTNE